MNRRLRSEAAKSSSRWWFLTNVSVVVIACSASGCAIDHPANVESSIAQSDAAGRSTVVAQEPRVYDFYGPTLFERKSGSPTAVTVDINNKFWENFEPEYSLLVTSGTADGTNRVSSARIWLDGKEVLRPSMFSKRVGDIVVPVQVGERAVLRIELASTPRANVTVTLRGQLKPDSWIATGGPLVVIPAEDELEGVRLDFAANTFAEPAAIVLRPGNAGDLTAAFTARSFPWRVVGPVISVTTSSPVQKAVRVTLPYLPSLVPGTLADLLDVISLESDGDLHSADTDLEVHDRGISVDYVTNTISSYATHFSSLGASQPVNPFAFPSTHPVVGCVTDALPLHATAFAGPEKAGTMSSVQAITLHSTMSAASATFRNPLATAWAREPNYAHYYIDRDISSLALHSADPDHNNLVEFEINSGESLNLLAEPRATVVRLASETDRLNHSNTANGFSIGIELFQRAMRSGVEASSVTLHDLEPFTAAQYSSLRLLLRGLSFRWLGGTSVPDILLHRDLFPVDLHRDDAACLAELDKTEPPIAWNKCGKHDPWRFDIAFLNDFGSCGDPGPPIHLPSNQIEWRSSNNSIAVVSSGGTVLGVGAGEATITATLAAVPSIVAQTTVRVVGFDGSIHVFDDGPDFDDVYSVEFDGHLLGTTPQGGGTTFPLSDVSAGTHTLRITCTLDGTAAGCGVSVQLSGPFSLTDGTQSAAFILEQGDVITVSIVAGPSSLQNAAEGSGLRKGVRPIHLRRCSRC